MAGVQGQQPGSNMELYIRTGSSLTTDAITYANLVKTGGLVLEANKVPLINEIGEPSQTPNSFEVTSYGRTTPSITIALPQSLDDYSITLNLDNQNARHLALMQADNGTAYEIAFSYTIPGNTADGTIFYGKGTIASSHPIPSKDANLTYTIGLTQTQKMVAVHKV